MTKYDRLPAFDDGFIHVVIETPRGAAAKLSYDPDLKAFAYSHPFDWGHPLKAKTVTRLTA